MSHVTDVLDQMIADPTINGQPVDIDKAFGGQCWDLVELFAERLGVPKEPWAIPLGPNGWASEAWTLRTIHMDSYFDRIPAGQQQKGDIVVFNGHGAYTEGHIAISLGGIAVFEENADPDGSPAHTFGNRNQTYLLGALRYKGSTTTPGGMMMVDKNLLTNYYQTLFNREPDPDAINSYITRPTPADVCYQQLILSDEYKKVQSDRANAGQRITDLEASEQKLAQDVVDRDKKIAALESQPSTGSSFTLLQEPVYTKDS